MCKSGLLLLFFFIDAVLFGQPPQLTTYTSKDGLSQSDINNVQLDKQGFLWIATNYGLNKFDGYSFTRYYAGLDNKENGLCGNKVKQVLCDSFLVWAAIEDGGVSCYFDLAGYFINYKHDGSDSNSLISNKVNCMALLTDRRMLIGTESGFSILNRTTNKFYNVTGHPMNREALKVTAVSGSGTEDIWLGTRRQGLFYFDKKNILHQVSGMPAEFNNSILNSLYYDELTGILWAASSKGVWIIKKEQDHYVIEHPLPTLWNLNIECIKKNTNNDYWIGTQSHGFYTWNKGNGLSNHSADQINNDETAGMHIRDIYFDQDNAAWLSTSSGLQYYHPDFQRFPVFKTNIQHAGKTIAAKPAAVCMWQQYLVTATEYGVLVSDTTFNISRSLTAKDSKNNLVSFTNISKIKDRLFISGNDGLYELTTEAGNFLFHRPVGFNRNFNKVFNRPCTDIIDAGNDDLLMANTDGMLLTLHTRSGNIDTITTKEYETSTGLLPNQYIKFYKDQSGRILIATFNGLFSYDIPVNKNKGAGQIHRTGSFHGIYITDIFDDGNSIWVATQGRGMYNCSRDFHTAEQYSNRNGLCDNAVMSILPGTNGHLWVATKRGLANFNKSSKNFTNYFESNGLQSQEFNVAGKYDHNGTLYFSTIAGIMRLKPAEWTTTIRKRLPITVTRMRVDGINLTTADLVMLNEMKTYPVEYKRDIAISFRRIGFFKKNLDTLQYKLSDNDTWSETAAGSEIILQRLSPGNHSLLVRTKENAKRGQQLQITLLIRPPWYQQWWFYLLVAFVIIAIVYTIFKIKVRQQMKIFEVRERISRDIHDEVGATLSGLGMYSKLAKMQIKSDQLPEVEKSLNIMEESTVNMIATLNDIVWLVNPKYDSLLQLVEKLEEFAQEMALPGNIKIHTFIPELFPVIKLKMEQRRNLYLIFKEAVNNAVKYSTASSITLSLSVKEGFLIYSIADNGMGFDSTEIRRGNGLVNMQKRADEMGGSLSIIAEPGKGTEVCIKYKIT